MERNRTFKKVLFILLAAIFVLACNAVTGGGSTDSPSAPPEVINPPPVEQTTAPETAAPPEPEPAATEDEPVPNATPASVGDLVPSDSYEVTVTDARTLSRVYMGNYYYYPKADQMFAEVVVKVTNLTGDEVSIPWENIFVTEENGDAWYPTWGGYTPVKKGKTVDGSTVGVNEITDGKALVEFEEDAVFRFIWFITKQPNKTVLLFTFDNSPTVELVFK